MCSGTCRHVVRSRLAADEQITEGSAERQKFPTRFGAMNPELDDGLDGRRMLRSIRV